jgi:hypothetical protein
MDVSDTRIHMPYILTTMLGTYRDTNTNTQQHAPHTHKRIRTHTQTTQLTDSHVDTQVDSSGAIAVADLKGLFKQYVAEEEGENMISDARMDQLLADARVETFRGKLDTSKLVDAMSFQKR